MRMFELVCKDKDNIVVSSTLHQYFALCLGDSIRRVNALWCGQYPQ